VRPGAVATVSLIAAALGAAAALAVGKSANWFGERVTTEIVVRDRAVPTAAQPTVVPKPLPAEFQPARIYRERAQGVLTIYAIFDHTGGPAAAAQGSGFLVSKDGLVLTSAHVITDAGTQQGRIRQAADVYVEFADGDRVPARVVGYDPYDDVGVIRVPPRQHAIAPVPLGDSSRVVVGEPVAAIGSPFNNESSLSVGVVSATRRSIDSLTSAYALVDAIQTDAPINKGNSGGPLFDSRGEVIGINAQIRSDSGSGFEGVGFAVPINSAKRSLRQLVRSGKVAYAFVGISAKDVTPSIARRLGYPVTRGALIERVESGSAADHAGLRAGSSDVRLNGQVIRAGGDVVVAIDGTPVRSASDVVRIVSDRLVPGEHARFTIIRGSKRLVVPITVSERPR
jgi:S1-C subfamily serine protease